MNPYLPFHIINKIFDYLDIDTRRSLKLMPRKIVIPDGFEQLFEQIPKVQMAHGMTGRVCLGPKRHLTHHAWNRQNISLYTIAKYACANLDKCFITVVQTKGIQCPYADEICTKHGTIVYYEIDT